jgi:nucleoside diphosphate kinase
MERAAYIIKPEGMEHRTRIRQVFQEAGLKIVSTKNVRLTPEAVDILYPGLDSDLRSASVKYLTCAPVEIGVLEGDAVIPTLRRLLGDNTNPDECRPGTIRHKFGIRPGVVIGKAIYHLNALHGSSNTAEASRDLSLFANLSVEPEHTRAG